MLMELDSVGFGLSDFCKYSYYSNCSYCVRWRLLMPPFVILCRCINSVLPKSHNKNWIDVQRKNEVNNKDMSSLRTPWQHGPYTYKHTEQHKHTRRTPRRKKHSEKSLCYFRIFLFFFFFIISSIISP